MVGWHSGRAWTSAIARARTRINARHGEMDSSTNAGWIVATTPLAAWWTHWDVLREESHLAARFGEEFDAYRARVPRYL